MSSNFQQKMTKIKQTVVDKLSRTNENNESNKYHHTCLNTQLIIDQIASRPSREELCIQQPIIIQKKQTTFSKPSSARKEKQMQKITNSFKNKTITLIKKEVEPFIPIQIPPFQKKLNPKTINCLTTDTTPTTSNKQIQIKIERDNGKDKQCLKKLFKKIHKLSQDLIDAQKQNMQLKIQLENYKNVSKTCGNHQKIISKLEGDKYKLEVDLNLLKKLLDQKDVELKKINSFVPKQIIKEVVIEKPVEVQIEVPRIVPGPQRIVEKIVEIPKYIEIEKPVPISQPYEPPREIIKTIEVPTYIEKQKPVPVYVEKPVYHEKVVEVPVEMPPIEVPVYVDRFVPEDWQIRLRQYEAQMDELSKTNQALYAENDYLKQIIKTLKSNLQTLERHNMIKNKQTQYLMHHSVDYGPISPCGDISSGSVGYSISTYPHPRAI